MLGGGGYTMSSVARCWAYETARLIDKDIPLGKMPPNDYMEYFAPDYSLCVPAPRARGCSVLVPVPALRARARACSARACCPPAHPVTPRAGL